MAHAKSLITQMPHDAPERLVAEGCILYKEEKYEEAKAKFQESINMTGY
jgi:tetratricopeptide repeat protein 30